MKRPSQQRQAPSSPPSFSFNVRHPGRILDAVPSVCRRGRCGGGPLVERSLAPGTSCFAPSAATRAAEFRVPAASHLKVGRCGFSCLEFAGLAFPPASGGKKDTRARASGGAPRRGAGRLALVIRGRWGCEMQVGRARAPGRGLCRGPRLWPGPRALRPALARRPSLERRRDRLSKGLPGRSGSRAPKAPEAAPGRQSAQQKSHQKARTGAEACRGGPAGLKEAA